MACRPEAHFRSSVTPHTLTDRPALSAAWRAMFDYYVFGPADKAAAHLPEAARGNLAPMDEDMARRLRAKLLERLNR